MPDFSIHFFLTKQKAPSDITFIPNDISQEAKKSNRKEFDNVDTLESCRFKWKYSRRGIYFIEAAVQLFVPI